MDKRSTWAGRAGFKGVLALSAMAAVAVPASPAGAATSVGRFTTLTAGTNLGMDIEGVAVLRRTSSGTIGRIVVSDPTAGITANRAGVAVGRGSAEWVARPEAQAVVIHAIPAGGTTAGGPKVACADL